MSLGIIDLSYRGLSKSLKTDELKEIADAFAVNMERVLSTARLPARLLVLSHFFGAVVDTARLPIFGRDVPLKDRQKFLDGCSRITEECQKAIRVMTEKVDEPKHFSPEWLKQVDGPPGDEQAWFEWMFCILDALVECTGDFLCNAIDAMLTSMITGTWTAFETLAGDLWKKSVNAKPQYLAGLTGTASRIQKLVSSDPKHQYEAKKGSKTVGTAPGDDDPCEILGQREVTLGMMCKVTKGSYNSSGKMGTLLIETKRVQFTSLEAIREAYSLAFSGNVRRARTDKIDAALAARELDALSAVRNLIVHKAGKADSMYLDDWKSAPTAPKLEENEKLKLDGAVCQSLISPVLKLSVDLIKAVDTWLATAHGR